MGEVTSEDNITLSYDGSKILVTGTMFTPQNVLEQIERELMKKWDLEAEQWKHASWVELKKVKL